MVNEVSYTSNEFLFREQTAITKNIIIYFPSHFMQVKLWDLSNNQPLCVASKNPKAVSDLLNVIVFWLMDTGWILTCLFWMLLGSCVFCFVLGGQPLLVGYRRLQGKIGSEHPLYLVFWFNIMFWKFYIIDENNSYLGNLQIWDTSSDPAVSRRFRK